MSLNEELPQSNAELTADEIDYSIPYNLALFRKKRHPRQADLILIHTETFPLGTPVDEAIPTAEAAALVVKPEGEIVSAELMNTPDHIEAGEYTIVVLVARQTEGA